MSLENTKSLENAKPSALPIAIALAVFALCFYVLSSYFSNTLGRVTLSGKFPPGTTLTIESQNKFGVKSSVLIPIGDGPLSDIKRVGSPRLNAPVRKLALRFAVPVQEVAAGRDVINLYRLQLQQPFVGLTVVSKESLSTVFSSAEFFGRDASFLRAKTPNSTNGTPELGGTATLIYNGRLPKASLAWSLLPAMFLGLLVWLIVRNHRFRDLPAFSDMSLGRKISSVDEFNTINGLRGLAALLVLFSHAAPGFEAVNVGIALLFVISGFLLSKPFVVDSSKIFDWRNVERYLVKRIKRILPMYYVFIFITYVLTYQFDTALRNFMFVEASGHLWPMTQIFAFYMLLPIVLMLSAIFWRLHRALPAVVLLLLSWVWFELMLDWKPFYNGRYFKEFYLHAFLMGVAGAYIQFDLLKSFALARFKQALAILLAVLAVLTIAWSAPVPPPPWIHPFISEFYGKCVMSLVIVILALQIRGTWVNKLLANPLFKSVGVVGFSFYLLHGLGMELATQIFSSVFGIVEYSERSWPLVGLAFCITYAMSLLTYSFIERPFFGYRENNSSRSL